MRLAINYQRVDPTKGGAETYVVDLCRSLVQAGHDVDLYAEAWRDDLLPKAVRRIKIEAPGRSKLARMLAFGHNSEQAIKSAKHDCSVGFINTWGTDVLIPQGGVHAASLEANSKRFSRMIMRSLYLMSKKVNPKYWVYHAIERKQYDPARGTHYVAVSKMVRGHLQTYHHVAGSHIHVIPNAIDPERLTVKQPGAVRCRLRNELGIAPGDSVGLFVGHNFWLKGLKPLLLTLAKRKAELANVDPVKLIVCGGGSLGPFRRMVSSLGLADDVHLLGYYDDVKACFHASDFFVSPTYYDPCSLVVFEALACGLPVITTACNGAGELMADGKEGFVVTAPDALGEISTAIGHMVNQAKRGAMAIEARRLGREQSFQRHVDRLVQLFEQVADGKQAGFARGPISGRTKIHRRAIL